MIIAKSIAELDVLTGKVGFVPTMGAFHEGHLDLMRIARQQSDTVVVSLFVNPTQFGKNEDFSRYPRDLGRDASLAASVGVDILFTPSVEEMYPSEPTTIHVPGITSRWEGALRPGHFDGVATIVAKLFQIVQPNIAYFGQKDLQQCLVVRKMVRDLNMKVQLAFRPTTRESDGLAMSSRNVYLSPEHRSIAKELSANLRGTAKVLSKSDISSEAIDETLAIAKGKLIDVGFLMDYFEAVDLDEMAPLRDLTRPAAIIAAGRLGSTRLIDNLVLCDEFDFPSV